MAILNIFATPESKVVYPFRWKHKTFTTEDTELN